jgi:hypothetical protein
MVGQFVRLSQRTRLVFGDSLGQRSFLENVDGLASGSLFGFLFGATGSGTQDVVADTNLGVEHSRVVRAGGSNVVERRNFECSHSEFLEPGLVIEPTRAMTNRSGHMVVPKAKHESHGSVYAAIEVDGANHSFECISQNRLLVGSARGAFAVAQPNRVAQIYLTSNLSKGDRVDHASAKLGELTFWELGVMHKNFVCDGQTEHGIAEELKALVRLDMTVLGAPRTVRYRQLQQFGVNELIADRCRQKAEAVFRSQLFARRSM